MKFYKILLKKKEFLDIFVIIFHLKIHRPARSKKIMFILFLLHFCLTFTFILLSTYKNSVHQFLLFNGYTSQYYIELKKNFFFNTVTMVIGISSIYPMYFYFLSTLILDRLLLHNFNSLRNYF